jgi:hypothetical protein
MKGEGVAVRRAYGVGVSVVVVVVVGEWVSGRVGGCADGWWWWR